MGSIESVILGNVVIGGEAEGMVLITNVPLSIWGGLDSLTGEIIDRRHPLSGQTVSGRVLALPHGRGSCSASGVLLEAIKNGTAPVAILTSRIDPVLSLGAILAQELYGLTMPLLQVDPPLFKELPTDRSLSIDLQGAIRWNPRYAGGD